MFGTGCRACALVLLAMAGLAATAPALHSDWLVAHGHVVLHIDGKASPKPHQLMAEARLVENRLIYRGDLLF